MNRHVQTIFCDDVRQEIGGKCSYIGVYGGEMFVPGFPVSLPKLCLVLRVNSPANEPFRSVKMRILRDEEMLAEGSINDAQLALAADGFAQSSKKAKKARDTSVQAMFVFSPFSLDGPCTIHVWVDTEAGELRGPGLRVLQVV